MLELGGYVWRTLWPCRKSAVGQAPGSTCGPVERGAHAGADLWAELVTLWWSHAGAVRFLGTASHGKDPCWNRSWWPAVCEINEELSPLQESLHWSSGGLWGVLPVRRKKHKRCVKSWPQLTFLILLCFQEVEEVEKIGSKIKLRKKGGMGKGVLKF